MLSHHLDGLVRGVGGGGRELSTEYPDVGVTLCALGNPIGGGERRGRRQIEHSFFRPI